VRERGRTNPVVNKRGKKEEQKKTTYPAKTSSKKKIEKSYHHGLSGNRPISPLNTNLRVSL